MPPCCTWLAMVGGLACLLAPSNASAPNVSAELTEFIRGMPKTALHMHVEGSLEPAMAFELAELHGMLPLQIPNGEGGFTSVSTLSGLEKVYHFTDLASFLAVYNVLATTLRTAADFEGLAKAYCVKALEENIVHAEIFFDPQSHTARGIPFEVVADGLNAGLDFGRERGLSIVLIASLLRDHAVGLPGTPASIKDANLTVGTATAWTVAYQVTEYNNLTALPGGAPSAKPPAYRIVGVGLDNNEVGFPPHLFGGVYQFLRGRGLFGVAHGGEEGPPEYVWECIDQLKVLRVDHGVRSTEDPTLVSWLAQQHTSDQNSKFYGAAHQTPVTVCPLSNYKLQVFKDPTTTSIIDMLDLGIMATVNSDDPAYFGGYATENYLFLLTYLNRMVAKARPIDLADVFRLCKNGFHASVLPASQKAAFLAQVDDFFLADPGLLYKSFNLTRP